MKAPQSDIRYDVHPPVTLLVGQSGRGDARLPDLLAERGVRLVDRQIIDEADPDLASGIPTAGIVVADLSAARGEDAPALLGRLGAAVRDADALVILPASMIDDALATVERPGLVLLPDPLDDELADALDLILLRSVRLVAEEGAQTRRSHLLLELGAEVGRIRQRIEALAAEEAPREDEQGAVDPTPDNPALLPHLRRMIRQRRLREQFFDRALFADPAWDMLLDLAAARIEGRSVAVSSLCIAAAVPPTTALRWISAMTEQGLLVRLPDPQDGRRVFVQLSDTAALAMARYVGLTLGDGASGRRGD